MTTDPKLDSPRTAVSNPPLQPMPANLGAGDVIRASAMPNLPPPTRQLTPVAKLIDVSKCIGCKACQSACAEWNDTQPEIGHNTGVYENPADLSPDMFTLMRFSEFENPQTPRPSRCLRFSFGPCRFSC